jgi:hypothetical protein
MELYFDPPRGENSLAPEDKLPHLDVGGIAATKSFGTK